MKLFISHARIVPFQLLNADTHLLDFLQVKLGLFVRYAIERISRSKLGAHFCADRVLFVL